MAAKRAHGARNNKFTLNIGTIMIHTDISALNTQFGITDQVTFIEGQGGLITIEINNAECSASIVLQGAHLTHWTPRNQKPVIWLSPAVDVAPNKAIRGGIPICWPWFGPHPTNADFPSHGIARTGHWEVIATTALTDKTQVSLRLIKDPNKNELWPYPTTLECHFTLGRELEIDLVSSNTGSEAIRIGQALHTYFNIGDIHNISVIGLEDCFYLDKVDGGKRKQQQGPVKVSAETDRIYTDTDADCLINDPEYQRQIRIEKRGSLSTVVWNPWVEKSTAMADMGGNAYINMLCVESANAVDDVRTLQPGDVHHL